jgi:hypothetical protein
VRHLIVHARRDWFCGWPANNGIWHWGDEVLVGFNCGPYQVIPGSHNINEDKPPLYPLARSLDGGETWTVDDHPPGFVGAWATPRPWSGKLDFSNPDLAIRCGEGSFHVSTDRGHHWDGPWLWPDLGIDQPMTSRTDYIIRGPREALFFLSAKDPAVKAKLQDRAFVVRTADGGQTFQRLGWITPDTEVRSVMPSTVALPSGALVTALRRRLDHEERGKTVQENWIDLHRSDDGGRTWGRLGGPVVTASESRNGNPPSLVALPDGALCLVYGYRGPPYGMRARLSRDEGRTFREEIMLRDDATYWDFGYPRSVVRGDGQVLSVYYYHTKDRPQQFIAATIWDPRLAGESSAGPKAARAGRKGKRS